MNSKSFPTIKFQELLSEPLRNGIYKKKEFHGSGSKIVNMGELFAYPRLKSNTQMKRVELNANEKVKSTLQSGDLIFARRSLTAEGAGKCSIVLSVDEETTFESSIIRARLNTAIANPEFYYYFFNSVYGKLSLGTILRQVAVAGITGSDLARLDVPNPPKPLQDKIAEISREFDEKIHLNTQTNQTLEQIAQAIFKSWFVDFDPVKAKIAALEAGGAQEAAELAAMCIISGKGEAQLAQLKIQDADTYQQLAQTAALFPAAMQESELGEIPEGWEVSEIGNEVEIVGGGTPSTSEPSFWEDGTIHWTTPKDLSNNKSKVLLSTERKITEAGLAKISSGLLPENTVLMSSRAPVGYLALAKVPVAINQGYIAMKCNSILSPEFIILWAESAMDEIQQRASGTTFAEINKKTFRGISLLRPAKDISERFAQITSEVFNKIAATEMQTQNLAQLRNSLLPKLLSGEVDLGELENSQKELVE